MLFKSLKIYIYIYKYIYIINIQYTRTHARIRSHIILMRINTIYNMGSRVENERSDEKYPQSRAGKNHDLKKKRIFLFKSDFFNLN